jgi:hypothetical protein
MSDYNDPFSDPTPTESQSRPFTATARQARQLFPGVTDEEAEDLREERKAELATARRIARGGERGKNDPRTDSASVIQAAQLAEGWALD